MKNVRNIVALILVIVFAVFVSNFEDSREAAASLSLPKVVLSGESFGVKMHTPGVLVISTAEVLTNQGSRRPAEELGLRAGDLIVSVNGEKVGSCAEVSEYIEKSGGEVVILTYERDGEKKSVALTPALSRQTGTYKAGLWIRDSSAGIGTVTFFENAGTFAALGHGVSDVDTGTLMPFENGEAVQSEIIGFSKAEKGKAGELYGIFAPRSIGEIKLNSENGVYGKTGEHIDMRQAVPTGGRGEIQRGEATLFTTIDGEGVQEFTVQIVFVSPFGSGGKDMIVRVTDQRLLQKTGGILQGMSGSPIVQNGKFVGALTHVFLNKPNFGYAVFGDRMVNTAKQLSQDR